MAEFNYKAAKDAGYSDQEIRDFLLGQEGASKAKEAGWTDDDILAHFGVPLVAEPPAGQIEGPARLPLIAASGAAEGLASTVGLPGTAIELGNKFLPNWLTRPIFSVTPEKGFQLFPEEPPVNFLPTMSDVTKVTNELGLTNRADLAPRDSLEKFIEAAATGVGASVPFLMTGGSPLAIMAGGAGGGMAAEGAHEAFPDNPWAPVVAGFAGGFGIQSMTQAIERGLSAKQAVKALAQAQQSLDDLKFSAPEQRYAIKDQLALAKRQALKEFEDTQNAAKLQLEGIEAEAQAKIGEQAAKLGKSATLQEAGTVLQESARKWVSGLPAKMASIWKPVDDSIPSDSPVELDAFRGALAQINKSAGALEPLATLLKPSLPKGLEKALGQIDELGELSGDSAFTWRDVQKLRTTLGDAMSDPVIIKDVGAQNLDQLYATLTADMRATAGELGDDALKSFDGANNASRTLFSTAEGIMSSVIAGARPSAADPLAEVVAQKLLSGGRIGGTSLETLRSEMPEALNELAAAHLKVGDWRKLSPEARAALVPDAQARSAIDDAVSLSATAKGTHAEAIKTAKTLKAQALEAARTTADVAQRELAGRLGEATKAAKLAQLRASAFSKEAKPSHVPLQYTMPGGALAGMVGLNALGLPGEQLVHGAIGTAAGVLAPQVVKTIWRNASRKGGLAGALAGGEAGNSLMGR